METDYEKLFAETYGQYYFDKMQKFIMDNDLVEWYEKAKGDPYDLCLFGFHFGLVSIVAFCYCKLGTPLDIYDVVDGYYKMVNSETLELVEEDGKRKSVMTGVSVIHDYGARDGLILATIDKYTEMRTHCMKYLLKMVRFSKYKRIKDGKKTKYIYTINDKYVKDYNLLQANNLPVQ